MPDPWIDLTRRLDADLPIYAEPGYADPPFEAAPWCGIAERGFAVWRLALGTQTGTHIDAPSHFAPGGATLDALAPDALIGPYFHVHAAALAAGGEAPLSAHAGETILFLDASDDPALPAAAAAALLALPCPVWVLAGAPRLPGPDPLALHRLLADAGRFLVEDLDPAAVPRVPRHGEVVALPLRLAGVSGSPARVLVRAADRSR